MNNRMAARASASACVAVLLVSLASALATVGNTASSCDLNTDCAAVIRVFTSGESSVRPPTAASTVRRRRLLRRTSLALSGMLPRLVDDDLGAALAEMLAQSDPEPAVQTLRSRYALLK